MKREHDLKKAEKLAVALPEKGKHNSQDIMEMWSKIKVLMSLDVDRLVASSDSKLVAQRDWMIGALIALNRSPKENDQVQFQIKTDINAAKVAVSEEKEKEKEEESKVEAAPPTGDSSNMVNPPSFAKECSADAPDNTVKVVPETETAQIKRSTAKIQD